MNIRIAAVVSALVLAAAPAQAVITSITLSGGSAFTNGGTAQVVAAPANVQAAIPGSNNVIGFNEKQLVQLGAVTNTRPQAFLFSTLANGVVPQGLVSSHIIAFNPAAGRTAIGTVVFNQRVIAVQRSAGQITGARSDQLETGVTDFTGVNGLEANDIITRISPNSISFNLTAGAAGSDVFRIITAVPEVSTWAMMFAGFGLVGFGMRRRRTAVAA